MWNTSEGSVKIHETGSKVKKTVRKQKQVLENKDQNNSRAC